MEDAPRQDQKLSIAGPNSKVPNKAANVLHKPNSIVFVRRRMLYARPAINSKGGVRFGLRHIRKFFIRAYISRGLIS